MGILQESNQVYNFSNIRYAAPPIGDLRFRIPEPPAVNRTHIQRGEEGRICPQATTLWATDIAPAFLLHYFYGQQYNGSSNVSSLPYKPAPLDPRTTEDCLFLDVVVPEKVFSRAQSSSASKKDLAPVLVWIYGGGYVSGDKSFYDPSGLIDRSNDGIVYVALNYRVSYLLRKIFFCQLFK